MEEEEVDQGEVLCCRIVELTCSNAALLAEIDLFERFINRIHPQSLLAQPDGDTAGASGVDGAISGGGGRRKPPSLPTASLQQLTLQQRLSVAQREQTETQQEQQRLSHTQQSIQHHYEAALQETELRVSDIRRAYSEFKRRLFTSSSDSRRDVNHPETLLLYIQDKTKDSQLEKVLMKIQALWVKEKTLKQQLQQRREAGRAEYQEVFQDFSEQRVKQNLDELETNILRVQRLLSSQKEMLESVSQELLQLSSDITNRKQLLVKVDGEIQQVEKELLKAEALNEHLQHQISDYEAPRVLDYIHLKHQHKSLQQSVHTWQRRSTLSQMKSCSRSWSSHRNAFTPANSAEAGQRAKQHRDLLKLPHLH